MPNVNLYDDKDYSLSVVYGVTLTGNAKWDFSLVLYGMPMQSNKGYTTKQGALKAGRAWIKKNIHDEIP